MVEAAESQRKVEVEEYHSGVEGTKNYRLNSGSGLVILLLAYGATLHSCQFKGKDGEMEEITLNRDDFASVCNPDKNPKYGVTCGRVAGRIGGAKFTIGETEHRLEANNGDACLHGGSNGFDRFEWDSEIVTGKKLSDFTSLGAGQADVEGLSGVKFTRTSPDMEQEFPGAIKITSWYLISSDNKLIMSWQATAESADCKTPINLTNHAYWNLSGDFSDSTVASHQLSLNCGNVLPMGPGSIPSGEIMPAAGTPFDFTEGFSALGDRERLTGAIDGGGKPGIDHAFLVNRASIDSQEFVRVGTLQHAASGRMMSVSTTQPAAVIYTANYLPEDGSDGKHRQHAAICLETCMLPNAVNMLGTQGWPSSERVLLSNGNDYSHVTMHEFSHMA